MATEKAILVEGIKHCEHKFTIANKEWDEVVVSTDDPEKRKRNTWHYYGLVDKCVKCVREELQEGGTILVPEGGDFFGGEYVLEPDGSRGSFIS